MLGSDCVKVTERSKNVIHINGENNVVVLDGTPTQVLNDIANAICQYAIVMKMNNSDKDNVIDMLSMTVALSVQHAFEE